MTYPDWDGTLKVDKFGATALAAKRIASVLADAEREEVTSIL